jgi:hypothetical protein
MKIIKKNSPNQSKRLPDSHIGLVICHTPEGSYQSAINTVMDPAAEVSYHLLIKKDGTEATQFVPWEKKAWHALSLNSASDGISVEGFARQFDLHDHGSKEMALAVAKRLVERNLKCQWTTDTIKTGFCRHGDLQSDRTDPTPDLAEWQLFVAMVKVQYEILTNPYKKDWPIPVPQWFWTWARWRLGVSEFKQYGPANRAHRPGAPVPPAGLQWIGTGKYAWAWRRLRALQREQRK